MLVETKLNLNNQINSWCISHKNQKQITQER